MVGPRWRAEYAGVGDNHTVFFGSVERFDVWRYYNPGIFGERTAGFGVRLVVGLKVTEWDTYPLEFDPETVSLSLTKPRHGDIVVTDEERILLNNFITLFSGITPLLTKQTTEN